MNLPEHLLNTKLCNKDTCAEIRTLKQENQRLKEQCITYEQERENVLNKLKWVKENQRLNNVLNELKEWFKEFHKYQSRLKWNENDYIEFIEHLENELKESDK